MSKNNQRNVLYLDKNTYKQQISFKLAVKKVFGPKHANECQLVGYVNLSSFFFLELTL